MQTTTNRNAIYPILSEARIFLTRTFLTPLFLLALITPTFAAPNITITAPTQAVINQQIEISFTGPVAKGDMFRFADSNGTLMGGHYIYVGNMKNNKGTLSVPVEPGDYLVAYVSNREIVASSPLHVVPVTATVNAPAKVSAHEKFEVTFSGPMNNGDQLRIADAQGKTMSGSYQYVGNAKNNRTHLVAPVEPGDYQVVYLTAKINIGSTPITVVGVTANLSMAQAVSAGARFPVEWQGPNHNGDVIQVLNTNGSKTGSYAYVGNNPIVVTLRAPEELGNYRVAYFSGSKIIGEAGFKVTAVSAKLDAPNEAEGNTQINVNWEGPGNRGDTIVMINPKTSARFSYQYIDKEKRNVAVLQAPDAPGNYELHYISHGKKQLASRAITITPAKLKPGTLQVVSNQKPKLGPNDALEVVLDASGSMLQRQKGERRIDIAKRTLTNLLTETVPERTPFALRVFGHKEADKCRTDLEIALSPLKRSVAVSKVANVDAMNLAKTPIADSLAQVDADLASVTGERIVILVTDGEETCDGDPADVIAGLRTKGRDIRVNIVGYAIDDEALRATFAQWADLGGGDYFNVSDEAGLAAALTSALNPSFTVVNQSGVAVAHGIAGGKPIKLAAGKYLVKTGNQQHPVEILPDRLSTASLKGD